MNTRLMITRRAALAGAALAAVPLRAGFAAAAAAEQPVKGGVLTVHLGSEQRILNPALRASTGVYIVTSKIVEALVDLDANGRPTPVLATGWTAAPDGRTITFTLRGLNYGTQLQQYLVAVDAPDPHTAVFRYSRPMPLDLLLRALCDLGYIAPPPCVRGQQRSGQPRQQCAGRDRPIPLRAVRARPIHHRRAQPDLLAQGPSLPGSHRLAGDHRQVGGRRVVGKRADPDQPLQFAAAGGSRPAEGRPALRHLDTRPGSERFQQYAGIQHPPQGTVRRAGAPRDRARDVPYFIDNFLYGQGKPATGPIPSSSTAFYPADSKPPYPFGRKRSESLLDEAGYKRGADGVRFPLKLVLINNGEDMPLLGTFIQQSLGSVGIRVEIVQLDVAGALTTVYRDWNFDIATGWHQYRGDPAVSTTVWYRSGSPKGAPWTNQYGWQSDTVDALTDEAASEIDPAKRRALYAQWVEAVNAEIPVWMVTERQFFAATSHRVHNHHTTPRWDSSDYRDVWITD